MNLTQFLIFEVCRECNLGAVHCKCPNMHPERYRGGDCSRMLTDTQIIDAAAAAYGMGFKGAVGFHYYNEPLLAKDRVLGLVDAIKARVPQASFILWTNGTLLPPAGIDLDRLKVFRYAWVTNYDGGNYNRIAKVIPRAKVVKWGLDNRTGEPLTEDNRNPCGRPFSEFVFDCYGNAHLCCLDWRGDTKLGNLHDEPFAAIWERFAGYRDAAICKPMLPTVAPACLRCNGRHEHVANLIPEIARDAMRAVPIIQKQAGRASCVGPVRRSVGVVFVNYRVPAQRLIEHFSWNDAIYRKSKARVFVVVDRLYEGMPDYVRQLVYAEPMPIFNLSATKNFGIRHAIESGCDPIIATDVDIMYSQKTWDRMASVVSGEAVVPVYRMAKSFAAREIVYDLAPNATGTVAMTADDWRRAHYHEGCVGYGGDDGVLLKAIAARQIKTIRVQDEPLWHIAHIADTPQKEFCRENPRIDHWGRDDGFNKENFAGNRKFYHHPLFESPTWGLPAKAKEITFVMVHYRMPEERLRDCIAWNREGWERIGARVIVVSDRASYDFELPEWVRVAQFPRKLDRFNLAATANYGIRLAGSGIICKTDPDILWPAEALARVAGVTDARGECFRYLMADSTAPADLEKAAGWDASKGTMALTFDHWQAINGYDERMDGYGIEDGDAFHRAGVGCKPARDVARDATVYHIAHTVQAQGKGRERPDCWGRADGFNPKAHKENTTARRTRWENQAWGTASIA